MSGTLGTAAITIARRKKIQPPTTTLTTLYGIGLINPLYYAGIREAGEAIDNFINSISATPAEPTAIVGNVTIKENTYVPLSVSTIMALNPSSFVELNNISSRSIADLKDVAMTNGLAEELRAIGELDDIKGRLENIEIPSAETSSAGAGGGGSPSPNDDDDRDGRKARRKVIIEKLKAAWANFAVKMKAVCTAIWAKVKVAAVEAWKGFWNGVGKGLSGGFGGGLFGGGDDDGPDNNPPDFGGGNGLDGSGCAGW